MTLVQTEPKKIYIWVDEQGWQPGPNTVLYVPMKSDLLDHSSNQFTLTNNGVTLASNQASIVVGSFDGSSSLLGANNQLFNFGDIHLGAWFKMTTIGDNQFLFAGVASGDIFFGYQGFLGRRNLGIGRNGIAWDTIMQTPLSSNTWYYLSLDRSGTNITISVNAGTPYSATNSQTYITSGGYQIGNDGNGNYVNGYISELIIENKGWTSQEISDYYDQTKGDYGL